MDPRQQRLHSIFRTIGTNVDRNDMLKSPTRWNPVELFLLFWCGVAGVFGVFFPSLTSVVARETTPGLMLLVWYTGLTVGSAITLYGLLRFKFRLATIGYCIVGPFSVGFSVTLMTGGTSPLAFSILLTLGFGLAGILRGIQLFSFLRRIEREVR
jgi:hypothetical protein